MNGRASMNLESLVREDLDMVRRNWGWFVGLGVILVLAGLVGLALAALLTLASVLFVGLLLILSGSLEVGHAIWRRGWQGFLLDLLSGLVTLAAGVFIVLLPATAAGFLTLVIGVLFLLGGALRIGLALSRRNPYGAWTVMHGLVGLLLGGLILAGWPISAEWVIGTLVAIDLLVNGVRLISLGLAVRSLPWRDAPVDHPPAAPVS